MLKFVTKSMHGLATIVLTRLLLPALALFFPNMLSATTAENKLVIISQIAVFDSNSLAPDFEFYLLNGDQKLRPQLWVADGDSVYIFEAVDQASKLVISTPRRNYTIDSISKYCSTDNIRMHIVLNDLAAANCFLIRYNSIDYFEWKSPDCHPQSKALITSLLPLEVMHEKKRRRYKPYYSYILKKYTRIK